MSRSACIFFVAAMFGAIDLVRSEETPAPPRYAPEPTTRAEADETNPSYEDRSQSPPYLDGDQRRALLEMARSQDAEQIPTLLKAAHYLDVAGLQEEAAKVRALAARRRAEWQTLFDEKSAELKKLQADVEALRKALGDGQQVQIDVRILVVSRTKLRQLGFDWANVTGSSAENRDRCLGVQHQGDRGDAPRVIDAGSPFFRVLELLGSRHVAKVIAEPSVTTGSGRPAFFEVSEDSAPRDDAKPARLFTRAELLPTVADDGRIHLKLKVRVGSDPSARLHDEDAAAPTREVQVAAWLRPGQTLFAESVLAHRLVDPADSPRALEVKNLVEQVEYVILATPKLVDASVARAAAPGAAPSGPTR
ncbi:MAG TPA: hypothetical protein VHB99_12530 [Pirellulales bacterium]|nr:hypothetical protein [Pirellulales bacterium]